MVETHIYRMMEQEWGSSFMRRAIALARHGMTAGNGGPFGAVVVQNGIIVGEGWNQVLSLSDPTAHGEMMAIRDACRRLGTHVLEGCDLFTTGEPCPMCLGAIYWSRIRSVYYGFGVDRAASIGFDDAFFYQQLHLSSEARSVPCRQLLAQEAETLVLEYVAMPNRMSY